MIIDLFSIAEDCMQDGNDVSFRSKMFQSEHALQLLQAYYYSGASHETSDRGMWQKIYQNSKPSPKNERKRTKLKPEKLITIWHFCREDSLTID